jgi:hypothetical protein
MSKTETSPTIGARGGVVGRPRKDPPAHSYPPPITHPPIDAAARIEELGRRGYPIDLIAPALRTSKETLRRWFKEDPALHLAYMAGRADLCGMHLDNINRDAADGERANSNSMFILKAVFGFREGEPVDTGVPQVAITFNLPGAMSRDDFMKTVVTDERT